MICGQSGFTDTTVNVWFAVTPANLLAVEVQYGTRVDFKWGLAPIVRTTSSTGMTLVGLNQDTGYFIRCRAIQTNGLVEDWTPPFGFATFKSAAQRILTPANITIEPAIIVAPEPVLEWAADNQVAGYEARSLGRDNPMQSWWSDAIGGKHGVAAVVSGAPVDTFALLETNASEDMTIKITAGYSPDQAKNAPLYTYGPVPFRASARLPTRRGYHSFVRIPQPQTFRAYRLEMAGPVPGGRLVATYAAMGLARTTKNFALDKGETIADYGTIERDRAGTPNRLRGHRGRLVDFDIANMTEAQYEGVMERIRWLVGTTEPALVVPNSKPGSFLHDRILYGQLRAGRASNPYSPLFTQAFTVDSLI